MYNIRGRRRHGSLGHRVLSLVVSSLMLIGILPIQPVTVQAVSGMTTLVVNEDGRVIVPETGNPADIDDVCFFTYDETTLDFDSCGEEDDWVVAFINEDQRIVLRNFNYDGDLSPIDLYQYHGPVILEIESDSTIIMHDSDGIEIPNSLTIEGGGNLVVTNHTGERPEGYTPTALTVGSDFDNSSVFINHCTGLITCSAEGDLDFNIDSYAANVANTGYIDGRGAIAGLGKFVDLIPCTTTYTEPSRAGYIMKGKAYYYDDMELMPNNIIGTLDEQPARIVGQYNEEGFPITSTDFYQNYMVSSRGTWVTMDFDDMYQFLVYGTTAEVDALPTPDDIVSVQDKEVAHTFNTDLYWAITTEGSMTVNGNITGELTLMENAVHTDYDEEKEAFAYGRDANGNIEFMEDSSGAKVIINGDVGFAQLNKSYKGDASINGKTMGILYADDVNVEDYGHPETWEYGAAAKAGQIVNKGSFVSDAIVLLEGFNEIAVYNEEYCYVMTSRSLNNEDVVGTTAVVDDQALLIDVSEKNLPEDTHPLVREISDSDETAIVKELPESTKMMVIDIALISENTTEVEPTSTVNLYMDGIEGFTNPVVYHIKDDGGYEKVYTQSGEFDGSLTISVDSFSVYIIAEEKQIEETTATTEATTSSSTETSTSDASASKSAKDTSPKTGDSNAYIVWMILLMLSSLAGGIKIIKDKEF